ncbi:MAG: LysR family transcriptional regulator [Myxococcota bacterium]
MEENAEKEAYASAITLEQLLVLVTIEARGSFSAAARHLGKAQGSVSYQVERLEEQLGVLLFDRSRRRPQLSAKGRVVFEHARQVLAAVDSLREDAWSWSVGVEAEVRLAIDVLFPADALVRLTRRFQAQFPSVRLSIASGVVSFARAALREGTADLAVGPPFGEGVRSRALGHIEMVPVAAPEHPLARANRPISARMLQQHVHLMLFVPESTEPGGKARGFRSRTHWTLQSSQTRLALLRAGLGWSRLPMPEARPEFDAGRLVRLSIDPSVVPSSRVPLYVAIRQGHLLGLAGRWLWDSLSLGPYDDSTDKTQ